jgi:glycoside/pentoside/hexuronide:cation symporter, GPH family
MPQHRPRLTASTKVAYGLGTVAYGVKDAALSSLMLIYYNQVVGLPADVVGAAIAIALIVDAFIDPFIGYASDNLRSPWGRRHPFMYAAALPAGAAFYFLFNPPAGLSEEWLFSYLLASMVSLRVLISFYEVPSAATGAELSHDYDERTSIMSYRFFFGAIGAGMVAVVTFAVFLRATEQYPVGQLNPEGYASFAIFGAFTIIASILVSTRGTHHFIPYMHVPEPVKLRPSKMLAEMYITLKNRNFLVLLLSGVFGAMFGGLSSGLGIYFNTYLWELGSRQISYLAIAGFAAPFLAVVLAPWCSSRFGKKLSVIYLLLAGVSVGTIPIALRIFDMMAPNNSTMLLAILMLAGVIVSTVWLAGFILMASMIADLSDEVAVNTGRRSEGVLFSADAILKQTIVGAGTFLAGLMLTWVEFPPKAMPGEIDPNVMISLASLYLPVAIVLCFLSIGLLTLYRHDRASHEANLQKLSI